MRTVISTDDLDGNPASLSVAGVPGEDYSFTYDYTQRHELFHINKQGSGGGQFFEYTYDKNGNLRKRQDLLQGGDYTWFAHDKANRLTWCEQFTGPGVAAYSITSYDYDESLNRLKSIGRKRKSEDPYMGEGFLYDDDNQLSNVTYNVNFGNRPGPPGVTDDVVQIAKDSSKEEAAALEPDSVREPFVALAPPMPDTLMSHQVSYSNDAIRRNQMTETINGVTTVTNYNPNALNQSPTVSRCAPGQSTPCDPITTDYDGSFNLSGFDGWTYIFDADNRLVSANGHGDSATFIYDGLGRCVRRTIDGVQTVITYDDWKPIIEWSGSGEFVAWNLYGPGPDEILVRYQPNTGGGPGATAYMHYHLDGLGNVEFLLSVNNLGLEKYSYDAFGQPTIKNWDGVVQKKSPNGNRFMFTGREYIYTLGLYDYRHRMYHPQLGRFMQVDPVGFKGDPMNLFRYCMGDPIGHGDPTGLWGEGLTSIFKGDWIKRADGIPTADVHLLNQARVADEIKAFEAKMNQNNPNVKWSAHISEDGKADHTIASTQWTVAATASSSANGKIACFDNDLQVTIHWNEAASGDRLLLARNMDSPKGEFMHTRDAFKYGTESGPRYSNVPMSMKQIGQFTPARDVANGVAKRLIGSGMAPDRAAREMEAALNPWAIDSMRASKRNWDPPFSNDHNIP